MRVQAVEMTRNNRAWKSQMRDSHISTASTASMFRHNNSTSTSRFVLRRTFTSRRCCTFRSSSLLALFCHAICASNTLSAVLKTQSISYRPS